jgi:chromosome segregation ATPase
MIEDMLIEFEEMDKKLQSALKWCAEYQAKLEKRDAEIIKLRAEVEKWRKNAEDMQRDWASPIEVTAHKHTIDALTQSVNNNAARIVDLRAEVAELKNELANTMVCDRTLCEWRFINKKLAKELKP